MKMTRDEVAKKVLGKAFFDLEAVLPMLRHCDLEDFPPEMQPAFVAIREAALQGREINVDILADQDPALKDLLLGLTVKEFTAVDQPYWVTRLKEFTAEARAVEAVGRISDLLLKDERPYGMKKSDIEHLWDRAMTEGADVSRMISLRDVPEEGPPEMRSVGFPAWEEMTSGLAPGTVHVLAGRPGRGKSTLLVQMANGMAKAGFGSLLVPLEMGAKRTAQLAKAQGNLEEGVHVLMSPPRQWPTLALDLKWAVQAGNVKGIFIDHLGYLRLPRRKDQTRVEEIGEILRSLHALVERTGAACVLVCQLNRRIEGRRSEEPELSDLRESGDIEQEADTVSFLWCKRDQLTKAKADCMVSVAKSRYGVEGRVAVVFDRPGRSFLER